MFKNRKLSWDAHTGYVYKNMFIDERLKCDSQSNSSVFCFYVVCSAANNIHTLSFTKQMCTHLLVQVQVVRWFPQKQMKRANKITF